MTIKNIRTSTLYTITTSITSNDNVYTATRTKMNNAILLILRFIIFNNTFRLITSAFTC